MIVDDENARRGRRSAHHVAPPSASADEVVARCGAAAAPTRTGVAASAAAGIVAHSAVAGSSMTASAAALLDGAQPVGAVGAGAGQHHADHGVAVDVRGRFEQHVDRRPRRAHRRVGRQRDQRRALRSAGDSPEAQGRRAPARAASCPRPRRPPARLRSARSHTSVPSWPDPRCCTTTIGTRSVRGQLAEHRDERVETAERRADDDQLRRHRDLLYSFWPFGERLVQLVERRQPQRFAGPEAEHAEVAQARVQQAERRAPAAAA